MSTSLRLGTGKSKLCAASAVALREQPPHYGNYALVFAVVLVALVVRLIYLAEIHSSDVVRVLLGDARAYDGWAKRILAEGWIGRDVFYQAPLYPYFLALVYKFIHANLMLVRGLQIVIGAISCGLLAAATARLFSPKAGLIAGLGLALYAPAIFFDALIQKSVLDLFFMTAFIYLFVRFQQDPTRLNSFLIGANLGLFALTRENALVLIPLVVIWIFIHLASSPRSRRLVLAASVLAGVGLILVPVGWRNYAVGGVFLPTTSQFGPNFYIGNNPQANGMYQPLRPHRGSAEFERQDATELAEAALGRKLSPAEVSNFWSGAAFSYMRSAPGDWLRLLARKWFLMWNARELMDTESIELYSQESWLLAALVRVTHFGILFPLAAASVVLLRAKWQGVAFLGVTLVALTSTGALFFVMARYRYPLVPILVLLAAAGIVELRGLLETRQYRLVLMALCAAGAAAVFVNWPTGIADQLAESHCNVGIAFRRQGNTEAAIRQCRKAVKRDPHSIVGMNNLAWMLSTGPESEEADREAVSYAERACRLTGYTDPALLDTLAVAYAELGRFDEAIIADTKALGLLSGGGDSQAVSEIRQHIDLFTNHQRYRQTLEPADLALSKK